VLVACLIMASLEELRDVAARAAETGGRIVRAGAGRGAEASEKGLPGDYEVARWSGPGAVSELTREAGARSL
jgi:hypothetical protein